MTNPKRIVQNATFLSAAYVGQKLLSFIYFTLIARFVGVVDTGAYVFALSYSTICSVFVDFGLSSLLQREIARKPEGAKSMLGAALRLKLLYAISSVAVGLGVFVFVADDAQAWRMIFIAMAIMLVDSYSLTVWAAFRGKHYLSYESVSIVAGQAVVMVIGLLGLMLRAPLEVLMLALLGGSLTAAVYAAVMCRRLFGFWPLPGKARAGLVAESVSCGVASTFSRLFASLDSVILGQMAGKAALGFYAIPNKFVFAAQFVPAAVSASLYPALSHYHGRDELQMRRLFLQALTFLFILAAPMATGLYLLTPMVIHELYTKTYDPSIAAMQVLVWGIVFGFLEYPFGAYISASGEQHKNSITRVVVVLVNIALNILLIPKYSFVGTAAAALVSYAVLTGMGAFWTRHVLAKAGRVFYLTLVRVVIAASIMGVGVAVISQYAHFVVAVVFGVILYAAAALVLGVATPQQIKSVLQLFKREPVADQA